MHEYRVGSLYSPTRTQDAERLRAVLREQSGRSPKQTQEVENAPDSNAVGAPFGTQPKLTPV